MPKVFAYLKLKNLFSRCRVATILLSIGRVWYIHEYYQICYMHTIKNTESGKIWLLVIVKIPICILKVQFIVCKIVLEIDIITQVRSRKMLKIRSCFVFSGHLLTSQNFCCLLALKRRAHNIKISIHTVSLLVFTYI